MSTETRPNLKYTRDHEWLLVEGDVATIGITQHAQEALGDLVYVELPEVGRTVSAGDDFAVVESVKAASEVYSPVSGEIIEANDSLDGAPETINEAPYEDGWIVKIKLSDTDELAECMDAGDYEAFVDAAE